MIVPDDKTKNSPLSGKRISSDDADEVGYWCSKFDCRMVELIGIVVAFGGSVSSIETNIHRIKSNSRTEVT